MFHRAAGVIIEAARKWKVGLQALGRAGCSVGHPCSNYIKRLFPISNLQTAESPWNRHNFALEDCPERIHVLETW